jgi:heterodisulfide reductase subunit C
MMQNKQDNHDNNVLAELIDQKKLTLCVECGKCVAGCPMVDVYEQFSYKLSARGIIKKALLGLDLLNDINIWFCLACDTCARICPAGVKYAEFIETIRQLVISEGKTDNCRFCESCGRYFVQLPLSEHLKDELGETSSSGEFLDLCPHCRRDSAALKMKLLGSTHPVKSRR